MFSTTNRKVGAVLNTMHWDTDETRNWLILQFTGNVALNCSRCFLVVSIIPMAEEFDWNEAQCGIVLAAFYWGYLLTQIIGGNLSDRLGGDVIQFAVGLVGSIATLSSIYLAQTSIWPLVCARFFTGLAQGMHYPALTSLIAHKVAEHSRTKFYSIACSGAYGGAMLIGFIGSSIIQHFHWKLLVIIAGCFNLMWVIWLKWMSSSHHKKLHYRLSDGLQQTKTANSRLKLQIQPSTFIGNCRSVPWKQILSHSSVIAYLCAFVAESSYIHIIPSWSPTYFSEVYPNQTKTAWLYNGAPSLVMATGGYSSGIIVNQLIAKYDVTIIRKLGSCVCLLIPSVCLILISLIGRGSGNYPTTLALLLCSSYFYGYSTSVISINCMDLTPAYSGSLYGVANTLGALPGVFAVPLVGYILHTTDSWTLVFFIQTILLSSGCVIFLVYGSAQKLQLSNHNNISPAINKL